MGGEAAVASRMYTSVNIAPLFIQRIHVYLLTAIGRVLWLVRLMNTRQTGARSLFGCVVQLWSGCCIQEVVLKVLYFDYPGQ